MQINNTIFERKHHYMLALKEIDILKKQMEYEVLHGTLDNARLTYIYDICNRMFAELLKEGFAYQYIKDATDSDKDYLRITVDMINYDCNAATLKKILGDEYNQLLNIENSKELDLDTNPAENKTVTLDDIKKEKSEIESPKDIIQNEIPAYFEPSIPKEVFEYVNENEKLQSTMVLDKYKLKVYEQGALVGCDVECVVAPLSIVENATVCDIMVFAKSGNEIVTSATDTTKTTKTVTIDIAGHSFLIRGSITNGNFKSEIHPSGITAAIYANINKEKVEYRDNDIHNRHSGHIVFIPNEDSSSKIHVVPISFENDKDGMAEVFVCHETNKGKKLFSSSQQKLMLLEDDNEKLMQLLNYWEGEKLVSEVIERD